MTDYESKKEHFVQLLLEEEIDDCVAWTRENLEEGTPALEFFNQVFTPAMAAVGDQFGRLEIFLPELMDAAEKAKAVSEQVLQPIFLAGDEEVKISRGKVVLCSVKGDLHDIGKNMVGLMLKVNGFDVIDLGIDIAPQEVLGRAKEVNADIIGLSSLMTTSMPYMKECVELRDGFGMKGQVKVIVGGAPITAEYARQIGADAFGRNAIEGVQRCLELVA